MAKVKTLKQWKDEAQTRSDTYNKKTYLFKDGKRLQITFKEPDASKIGESIFIIKEFRPTEQAPATNKG